MTTNRCSNGVAHPPAASPGDEGAGAFPAESHDSVRYPHSMTGSRRAMGLEQLTILECCYDAGALPNVIG